ncbi:hypothetical protein SVIOM342S_06813 [Streptomyces violaceorubidus]
MTRPPGLLRQENRPGQAPHPGPALPRQTPCRRPLRACSRRAPSTNRGRQPQSPDQRVCKENDSISLNVEAEHRMAVLALRVHQHRLAQPPPDLPKEAAEHIKSILALQLPQVDVEVDFIGSMETEDRQHIGGRPDPQVRALGIRRDGTARPPPGAPEAPSLPRSTGTSSPSPRQDRGPPASPPPRHPGPARPATTPSSPGRRNTSRHPTAGRHPAMLPGAPTRRTPVSLDQRHRGPPPAPRRSSLEDRSAGAAFCPDRRRCRWPGSIEGWPALGSQRLSKNAVRPATARAVTS